MASSRLRPSLVTPAAGPSPGSRVLETATPANGGSISKDEAIWKRLREAGFDEEAVKKRDKAALIAYITKLEFELYDYQYNMGLLILEKKEWMSKYEQVKASADLAEITYKHDQAAHAKALAEARKQEESLKRALAIEKECVTNEFCSVGDDSCLILWDARVGTSPVIKVEKAHDADLHCVDWNRHDENLILTGSADTSVRLFDRRKLTSGAVGSPLHIFQGHEAAVLCVQWCPDKASVFGSAAEDSFLNVWDHEKVGKQEHAGTTVPKSPPGLFFQHAGHRDKVVDFHWNTEDPWTIVSVSNDCERTGGGGTLQIWRMNDLIYRPEGEVLSELNSFKDHILSCAPLRT